MVVPAALTEGKKGLMERCVWVGFCGLERRGEERMGRESEGGTGRGPKKKRGGEDNQ